MGEKERLNCRFGVGVYKHPKGNVTTITRFAVV